MMEIQSDPGNHYLVFFFFFSGDVRQSVETMMQRPPFLERMKYRIYIYYDMMWYDMIYSY